LYFVHILRGQRSYDILLTSNSKYISLEVIDLLEEEEEEEEEE